MRQCPSCGRMIADEAHFCTGCGAKVPPEKPEGGAKRPHPQSVRRCTGCGAELAEGMSFCIHCGKPVSAPPPAPGRQQPPGGSQKGEKPPMPGKESPAPGKKPRKKASVSGTPSWLYPLGIILSAVLVIAIGIGIAYLAMGDQLIGLPAAGETEEDGDSTERDEENDGKGGAQEDREDVAGVTGGTDSGADDGAVTDGEVQEAQEEEETYLTLNVTFMLLQVGDTGTLTAETNGSLVTWTVEDGSVLTLVSNGAQAELTALSAGSTTVTAACDGLTAQCEVSVPAPAQQPDPQPETDSEPAGGENPALTDPDGYLLPTDTRVISESELYSMSREEVALARNEIYARHGHIFENDTYRVYFEGKNWYTPDPDFDALDASQLTAIELENINIIVQYEQRMGWRK